MHKSHQVFADALLTKLSSALRQSILEELARQVPSLGGDVDSLAHAELVSENLRMQSENATLRGLIAELRGYDRTAFATSATDVVIDDVTSAIHRAEHARLAFVIPKSGDIPCEDIDGLGTVVLESKVDLVTGSHEDQQDSKKRSIGAPAIERIEDQIATRSPSKYDVAASSNTSLPSSRPPEDTNCVQRLVKSQLFDTFSVCVILFDILCLSIQCQWQSYGIASELGLRDSDEGWNDAKPAFFVLRVGLCTAYSVELFLRVVAFKLKILRHPVDAIDAVVIILIFVEICMGSSSGGDTHLVFNIGRLPYLVRALKILTLIAHSHVLADLRILMRTVVACAHGLISVVLGLLLIIFVSSLVLTTLTFIILDTDDSLGAATQKILLDNYGSLVDTLFTMFEATLSSAWVTHARFLVYEVNHWMIFFWFPFIICVQFMFVKIIGAVVVKQVMEIAAHDQEKMAMARIHNSQTYAVYIKEIFKAGDTSGDGVLSRDEFKEMQRQPEVMEYFEKLGLDGDEVQVLFDVLSADDGVVDFDEFLSAALKLKNSAKTIDTMQINNNQRKMMQDLRDVRQILGLNGASKI